MNQDLEHLRLLSIFHYVLAGFGFLFSLFPIIYLVLGGLMVTGSLPESANASGGLDQQFAGWIFLAVGAGMMLFGLVFATGLFLGGQVSCSQAPSHVLRGGGRCVLFLHAAGHAPGCLHADRAHPG